MSQATEAWPLRKCDKGKLLDLERKIQRKIFGLVKDTLNIVSEKNNGIKIFF